MTDENEFFREGALLICSSLNVDTALKRLMAYLKKFMPVSGIGLGVYDMEMNVGRILSLIWPDKWEQIPDTIPFSKEFGEVIRQRWSEEPQTRVINDILTEDKEERQIMLRVYPEASSHIHMDLELEQRRLGRIMLFVDGKHQYKDAHAQLISLLHDPLAIAMSNILQYREITQLRDLLDDENRYLRKELITVTGDQIIGVDFGLKNTMAMVRQVSPLNSPVLLIGETGVGKELVANAIHESSGRKDKPFIKVNCGAIPESLMDSELFGHEKGAFTGALSQRKGRFERADQGTIFLDEIGELPVAAQVRLLRVLQQHEIERVGGSRTIPIDVRIISATHRNLEEMLASGQFREDLWFRLNVFPIMIPPLRQRTEDIPALVTHFIDKKAKELNVRTLPRLAPGSMELLQACEWPGNVRELENLVERVLIQSQVSGSGSALTFRGVLANQNADEKKQPFEQPEAIHPLDDIVAEYIRHVLTHTRGRVEGAGGAAELLRLHPSTLRARMKKLGLPFGRKIVYPALRERGPG